MWSDATSPQSLKPNTMKGCAFLACNNNIVPSDDLIDQRV